MKKSNLTSVFFTALIVSVIASTAHAGPSAHVYSPMVEYGENEIEFMGGYYDDNDQGVDGEQEVKIAFGRGLTTWWKSEIEFEWEKEPTEGTKYKAFEWVNIFQLSEQGEHWMDYGLFVEFKFPDSGAKADKIEIGPMFQKELGNTINNLNLIFVRDFGSKAGHDTKLEYTWQVQWYGAPELQYGIQGFGDVGNLDGMKKFNKQEHKVGPALFGLIKLEGSTKIKWDSALLFGTTSNTPDYTLRFIAEYEF